MEDYSYDTTLGKVTIVDNTNNVVTVEAKYIIDVNDKDDFEVD